MNYQSMTKEELLAEREALQAEYDRFRAMNLQLNMSRGQPSAQQLELSIR